MPLFIGLILIPFIVLIIRKSNMITTNKKTKILLNISLILITLIFIIFCWIVREPPFDFKDTYSWEYMLYDGDYILYSGVIVLFTPFIWIIAIHFVRMLLKSIRVKTNSVIKRNDEYLYYRDDLDKTSPGIIMFTSAFEVDLKDCISATILKLKLSGYIKETTSSFEITKKDTSSLPNSEKMVLDLVSKKTFDKKAYINEIEKEALDNKYVVKNHGKVFLRILRIVFAIAFTISLIGLSVFLDDYTFENYHVWPEKRDNHAYIHLKDHDEIEQLYKEIQDKNDYSHSLMFDGNMSYNYTMIRADKLQYGVVRKAFMLNVFTPLLIGLSPILGIITLYIIINELRYIKKNYKRTHKGIALLNKAYALKNYLKNYSLIKHRTEKELILWEYYLVYAVLLDVNTKIEDKLIEKYVKAIV